MRSFSQDVSPTPSGTPSAIAARFDTDRAIFWARPNFTPLRDPDWRPLRGVRRAGDLTDETTVVTFDVQGKTLVLVSSQMAYHHVAQGEMEGEPWMVTF